MKRPDFTEVIAIVAKGERSHSKFQWELGDELIRAIGRPSTGTGPDGSYAKLEACSEALREHGYEYEPTTLKNLRLTAWRFQPDFRKAGLPWSVHDIAGTPEILDSIIEGAPRQQKITRQYAIQTMRAMALARQRELEEETERRRKVHDEARREREAAEARQRSAKTAAERREAEQAAAAAAARQKKHSVPPKRKDVPLPKPKNEDMPVLLARANFASDLAQIRRSILKLRETYEGFLSSFTDADIEAGHEDLMTIAEAARGFADLLRKRPNGKSGHLSVVGNGD